MTSTASSSRTSPYPKGLEATLGSMTYPIDANAPVFAAQAIVTSTILAGTAGATMGVIRSVNPFAYSINMGINGGLVGLTFFGLREYIVSPLLLLNPPTASYVQRYQTILSEKQLGKLPSLASENQSISDIRYNRLLDSSISGGLTGSLLSTSLRGVRTLIPAFVTSSLIATALQLGVNEVRVIRLKLLSRKVGGMDETNAESSTERIDLNTGKPIEKLANVDAESSTGAVQVDKGIEKLDGSMKSIFEDPVRQRVDSLPGKIMKTLATFLPVRKLSDEEYLRTLEKKKADVARRLEEIEVEERNLYDAVKHD